MATVALSVVEKYVAELSKDSNVIAVILTGSYARGEANPPLSDIDLVAYVKDMTAVPQREVLYYEEEQLIGIDYKSLTERDTEMQTALGALTLVPIWRHCQILHDTNGEMARRKKEAEAFHWDARMQEQANSHFSAGLYHLAEISHNILSGLNRDDWSPLSIVSSEMADKLGNMILVQRGIFINSHNHFYHLVQSVVGSESVWWRFFTVAIGLRLPTGWFTLPQIRGMAALRLYRLTVRENKHLIEERHRDVIETAVRIIEKHTTENL
jgi:predicted nucleotidyltransferase